MTVPTHVPLPPRMAVLGPVVARWEEIDPGVALLRLTGGSVDDRELARYLLRVELAHHGIEHAQFLLGDDEELRRTASWQDIMAKAKRLIQSGQVTLLRNSRNIVVAHVIGDHGEYNCEFSRDDPNSWAITGWQCECPWDQYAWQRTRKWKKYEGRVCAHVLAAFWYSRRHPMDEDHQGPLQRGMKGPGGAPPAAPQGVQQQLFTPGGGGQFTQMDAPAPGDQGTLFGQGVGMGQPTTPFAAPSPGEPAGAMGPPGSDIIPPQPMIPGMEAPQLPVPGTTPGGMQSPPNAVSVPGAKQPSPFNPIQYPGGTYSHKPSKPPHYRVQKDPDTKKCGTCVMFNEGRCWGYGNISVSRDGVCDSYFRDGRKTAATQFENGMKVRLLEPDTIGIAEGKSEAHGAGRYVDIPVGKEGEVMGQDATTGWVEVIFPLDQSGPMEPYHARCFLEPSALKIVAYPPGSPFVKRVGPHS